MLESLLGLVSLLFCQGFTFFVSYINNNTFPRPLSREEEKRYLQILKQGGTSHPMTTEEIKNKENARTKLIEHNLRLVPHLVNKLNFGPDKNEELISVGIIGLIKAVDSFNPDKGVLLSTYAARCIRNEIYMSLRAQKKLQSEVSLYNPVISNNDDNELSLMDLLRDEKESILDQIVNKHDQVRVVEDLKNISERERRVLELRYGLINGVEYSQQKVADILHISRSYVSRIEKKAIQKLKELQE